jgi:probable rRNA maturation factor
MISCPRISSPPRLKACERYVKQTLALLEKENWEVSLLFCDDETIRTFNTRYRKKDTPTDVLAFSQEEGERFPTRGKRVLAGDIVISLDTLNRNAQNYGVSPDDELKRLLVHGLLHLAGRDHGGDASRMPEEPMIREQENLLKELDGERIL